ncbi:MAG TPA: response regulator [Vicinamibacteria bacterium]|nr:response regulator [Vicinamibacteria bacterium]
MSVLIVEPNEDLQELMALSVRDCPVRLAARGDEALRAILAEPPLVIVVELDLAGLIGERLAIRARSLPDPPLIVLTSADHDRLGRAARYADRVLPKPFEMAKLEAAVAQGCSPKAVASA